MTGTLLWSLSMQLYVPRRHMFSGYFSAASRAYKSDRVGDWRNQFRPQRCETYDRTDDETRVMEIRKPSDSANALNACPSSRAAAETKHPAGKICIPVRCGARRGAVQTPSDQVPMRGRWILKQKPG